MDGHCRGARRVLYRYRRTLTLTALPLPQVLDGTADTVPQVRVTDMSVPFTSLVPPPAPSIPPPVNKTLALTLNTSVPAVQGYTFYTTQIIGFESIMLDFAVESGGERFELNFQSVNDGADEDFTLSVFGKQALPHNI